VRALHTATGPLEFSGGEPWLMAIVTPGPGAVERAAAGVRAGARVIGIRDQAAGADLIPRLRDELSVPLAVLTGGAESAEVALAAGAAIVDASAGIESPELPEICARLGAALVVPVGTPLAATDGLPATALMYGVGAGGVDVAGERPLVLHAESGELPCELAAVARGIELEASVLAVYDVAAAADFLAVHGVLHGRREIDPDLRLAPELRRQPAAVPPTP
jgi:hypothetical protein